MQYTVEYATQTFRFKDVNAAMDLAELMAKHKDKYSPWTPTIKVQADEEDKDE